MRLENWDGLNQTNEDIARKFDNTYVYASHPDVGTGVFYLSAFEGRHCRAYYGTPNERLGLPPATTVQWREIDVIHSFPETIGVVPHRTGVLILKRTASRQWSVGLGSGTGTMWDQDLRVQHMGYDKAVSVYSPVYDTAPIEEVVKRFSEKGRGLQAHALSSVYWLARRDDKIVLYRNRNLKMGSYVYGSFFLHGSARDFVQELWDDLHLRVKMP